MKSNLLLPVIIVVMCTIPSCRSKKITRSKGGSVTLLSERDSVYQYCISDIPVPITSLPIPDYMALEDGQCMVSYRETHLDMQGLKDYFAVEMERMGWQQKGEICGAQTALLFENPSRICIITIKASAKQTIWQLVCMVSAQCYGLIG